MIKKIQWGDNRNQLKSWLTDHRLERLNAIRERAGKAPWRRQDALLALEQMDAVTLKLVQERAG